MTDLVRATDVFGITRDLPMNYVTRPSVDDELVNALTRDQHLVIYGSSKQGKTSVRKYNLGDSDYVVITCSNKMSLGQLHAAILKAVGYNVVQSETRTTSGSFKIRAMAKISAKLLGHGGEVGAEAEAAGERSSEVVTHNLELDPDDPNDIIGALDSIQFDKYIVLEDFHYLSEETQKDFAVALKSFHESSQHTFIIVGVWLQENRLIQFNGDLSGRVQTINADSWSRDELLEAVTSGEGLLNVEFDRAFLDYVLDNCFESIYVVQETCLLAAQLAGVDHASSTKVLVNPSITPAEILARVVNKQSARFNDFIINFATGFGETDLRMYRYLLAVALLASTSDLEAGLHYRELTQRLKLIHPRGSDLNAGNISQALKSVASLQITQGVKPLVLDYDQSLRRLNVVDRSFLIWLAQQDRIELVDQIEVDAEAAATLSDTAPSESVGH